MFHAPNLRSKRDIVVNPQTRLLLAIQFSKSERPIRCNERVRLVSERPYGQPCDGSFVLYREAAQATRWGRNATAIVLVRQAPLQRFFQIVAIGVSVLYVSSAGSDRHRRIGVLSSLAVVRANRPSLRWGSIVRLLGGVVNPYREPFSRCSGASGGYREGSAHNDCCCIRFPGCVLERGCTISLRRASRTCNARCAARELVHWGFWRREGAEFRERLSDSALAVRNRGCTSTSRWAVVWLSDWVLSWALPLASVRLAPSGLTRDRLGVAGDCVKLETFAARMGRCRSPDDSA